MDIWLDGPGLSEEESDWIGWQADRQAMTARGETGVTDTQQKHKKKKKKRV